MKSWRCDKKLQDLIVTKGNQRLCQKYMGVSKFELKPPNNVNVECKQFGMLYNRVGRSECNVVTGLPCDSLCSGMVGIRPDCIELDLRFAKVSGSQNHGHDVRTIKVTTTQGITKGNTFVKAVSFTQGSSRAVRRNQGHSATAQNSLASGSSAGSSHRTDKSFTFSAGLKPPGMAVFGAKLSAGTSTSNSASTFSTKTIGTANSDFSSTQRDSGATVSNRESNSAQRSVETSNTISLEITTTVQPQNLLLKVALVGKYNGAEFPLATEKVVECSIESFEKLLRINGHLDYKLLPCVKEYLSYTRMVNANVDLKDGVLMCRLTEQGETRIAQQNRAAQSRQAAGRAQKDEQAKKLAREAQERKNALQRALRAKRQAKETARLLRAASDKEISQRLSPGSLVILYSENKWYPAYVVGHERQGYETCQLGAKDKAIRYKLERPPGTGAGHFKNGDKVLLINQHPLYNRYTQLYASSQRVAYHTEKNPTYRKGTWTIFKLKGEGEYIHAGDKIALRNVYFSTEYLYANPLGTGEYGRTWSRVINSGARPFDTDTTSASDFFVNKNHDPVNNPQWDTRETFLKFELVNPPRAKR